MEKKTVEIEIIKEHIPVKETITVELPMFSKKDHTKKLEDGTEIIVNTEYIAVTDKKELHIIVDVEQKVYQTAGANIERFDESFLLYAKEFPCTEEEFEGVYNLYMSFIKEI